MWLTRVSIFRPVTITMVVLAILVLGITSYMKLPVDLYPNIDFPWVTVFSTYPGAGPEEIETLVTRPIEDAVSTISGVKNVTSTSEEGTSSVGIEFELGTDLDTATNDVREKVDAARFELPADMEPPTIQKFDISAIPVVSFALSSPRPPRELRRIADDVIKDRLGRLKGVGAVQIAGGDVREILVAVDRDRLESYGLTIDHLVAALSAANLNLPSGNVEEGRREYAVRAVGEFQSPEEIRDVQLSTAGGAVVSLRDVAEVSDTVAERRHYARVDGQDSVAATVLKQSGANTVQVAEAVRGELMRLTGQVFDERGYDVSSAVPEPQNWFQAILFRLKPPAPAVRAQGLLPQDIVARITMDQSIQIRDALHDLQKHMIIGALLAVLVVFVFLHNFRGTVIVALAIPTSIIAAFTPMFFAGFTLNQMTMLALSVSVGILVDDSIVVIENIYRHLRLGEKPKEAAFNGRTEIGLAAITITLVDVVVFVPIAFMGGIVGQFFRQFGITVAITTLFSLFIAFTLTPMLSSRWYREEDSVPSDLDDPQSQGAVGWTAAFDRFYAALSRSYRRLLAWSLDHRLATVSIGIISLLAIMGVAVPPEAKRVLSGIQFVIALLAGLSIVFGGRGARLVMAVVGSAGLLAATFLYRELGGEFFPRVDQGRISVIVELPAGSSLEATDAVVRQIEGLVLDDERFPEVDSVYASIGSALEGGGSGASYAGVRVVLVDKLERTRSDSEIVAEIDRFVREIPGATIKTTAYEGMGGGQIGAPVYIELTASDMGELVRVADRIRNTVARVPGTLNADITWKVGKPEIRADVDRYRAADRGVSTFQLARALRTSLEGDTTSKYREGADQYDIRVRLREVDRSSLQDVSDLMVAYNGGPVYLADIADVSLASGPAKIDRKNRQRMVAVQADLQKGYSLYNVEQEIRAAIAGVPLGDVAVYFGGESEAMAESFGYLIGALALSVILIYILQAALFEGYLSPFIIMFALPMALVGALLALLVTGKTLSIVTMIGIIMLMGLVGKNAILVVDYTNTLRARGMSMREALLEAGPTRLRPVLMTSLSLIFGLLPVAAARAHGGEVRSPMAVAVIGGMALSTLLSLLVIPVLYTVFDGIASRFNALVTRILKGALS